MASPRVLLRKAVRASLTSAARSHAPHEVVAALFGTRSNTALVVERCRLLPNRSASRDAFAVDPAAFAAAMRDEEVGGHTWLGFAHSHPGGAPAPSQRDHQTLWPRCLHVILATANDGATQFGAFERRGDAMLPLPIGDEVTL